MARRIVLGLNAVILAVTEDQPRVLTVTVDGSAALPYGPLDPERHPTLERGLREWVREQTGLELGYVEQLYTFGDRDREPGSADRQLSIVYLALAREGETTLESAAWAAVYDFLPWEDWRQGEPTVLDRALLPRMRRWMREKSSATERRQRGEVAFGIAGAAWDGERVLERYELLYEAGEISESGAEGSSGLGRPMFLDHRRMMATALGRIRGKIRYRPLIFELLPERFTLWQLQRVAEALAGRSLHKQNFRRLVVSGGLVEGTGRLDANTGGRPAELFRFRPEVVRERRATGVGLPRLPATP